MIEVASALKPWFQASIMTEFSSRSPHFHSGRELVIRQKLTDSPEDATLHALLAIDLAIRNRLQEACAEAS